MTRPYLAVEPQALVLADAGHRCGYCHSNERLTGSRLSIEHLLPVAAGGTTTRDNLWRSCRDCNERKGAQMTATDPETGTSVALFNPRRQHWTEHFRWSDDGITLLGVKAQGRATVVALDLNRPLLLVARQLWVLAGLHPPRDS